MRAAWLTEKNPLVLSNSNSPLNTDFVREYFWLRYSSRSSKWIVQRVVSFLAFSLFNLIATYIACRVTLFNLAASVIVTSLLSGIDTTLVLFFVVGIIRLLLIFI